MNTRTLTTLCVSFFALICSTAGAQCPSQRAAVMPSVMPRPTYPMHRVPMPVMRPTIKQVRSYTQMLPSRPAPVAVVTKPVIATAPKPAPPKPNVALHLVEQAKQEFRNKQFERSIELMSRVINLRPKSSAAYQFRAMCYFAIGDYDSGAADAYDTLLLGPMWNWKAIAPLYASADDYEVQYQSLAIAAAKDEKSMSKHFLLAYHHLALGHMAEGKEELNKVLSIKPEEPLTKKLLATVSDSQKLASK